MIIFLNGTSSAGKTSVAKKIQELYPKPLLHMGIDSFFFSIDPRFVGEGKEADFGYRFVRVDDTLGPKVVVENGPYAKRLSYAMRQAFKTMVDNGISLIIDELLFSEEDFQDYLELFQDAPVVFVAIKPSQKVAEEREKMRGDRSLGLARGLYEVVYKDRIFDLEIDTGKMDPKEAAEAILAFTASKRPTAFKENFQKRASLC
jgi:chloramphenicol 3-O phosphotransferase